jgi:purine-cytosine permease-like protein
MDIACVTHYFGVMLSDFLLIKRHFVSHKRSWWLYFGSSKYACLEVFMVHVWVSLLLYVITFSICLHDFTHAQIQAEVCPIPVDFFNDLDFLFFEVLFLSFYWSSSFFIISEPMIELLLKFRGVGVDINFNLNDFENDRKQVR